MGTAVLHVGTESRNDSLVTTQPSKMQASGVSGLMPFGASSEWVIVPTLPERWGDLTKELVDARGLAFHHDGGRDGYKTLSKAQQDTCETLPAPACPRA